MMAATDARNSRRTVGNGDFCAIHAEAILRGPDAVSVRVESPGS
jgi:hypothetical protein